MSYLNVLVVTASPESTTPQETTTPYETTTPQEPTTPYETSTPGSKLENLVYKFTIRGNGRIRKIWHC